jgi:signal transduction histidine kinase
MTPRSSGGTTIPAHTRGTVLAVQTWGRLVARLRRMDAFRADLLLAGLLAAEMATEVALLPSWVADGQTRAAVALIVCIECVGIALRRRAPLTGAVLVGACFVALSAFPDSVGDHLDMPWFVILIAVYSLGANTEGRRFALGAAVMTGLLGLAIAIDADEGVAGSVFFVLTILIAGPLLLGRVIRHRSRLNRTLREKTRELEAARAARAQEAVLEERSRIAGELHDVVAHALSAMVVQAAAARRLVPREPPRAQAALASVEATGREALTEIRSLLGVLRREDEDLALAPQPSLVHASTLVKRTCAAGLPVELKVEGDARPLPAGLDLTAYRVLQAALGGAADPGGAGRAEVTLRYDHERVELEILDDGRVDADDRVLLGARERVALYGGELVSGPGPGGGHAVRARLPLGGAA